MKVKAGKILLWTGAIVMTTLVLLFVFISPIAKMVIEKNSEKWTGRKITMDALFINLLGLDAKIEGLKMYEAGSDTLFLGAEKVHANLSFFGLLKGEYNVKPVEVTSPYLVIEQSAKGFNYDDLYTRFTAEDTLATDTASAPLHYRIEAVTLSGGKLIYRDKVANQEIVVEKLNLFCPLIASDTADIDLKTDFSLQTGGDFIASVQLNTNTFNYRVDGDIAQLNLRLFDPYLKDIMKSSGFGGMISSHLQLAGNFDKPAEVALKGELNLSDFFLNDEKGETVTSWRNFALGIDTLNVASNLYAIDKVTLDDPYLLFEMYQESNNFTMMMLPDESATTESDSSVIDYSNPFTMMADYIKDISKTYLISNYTANNVLINNGHLVYKDYTLEDKFTYDMEELQLQSGRIDSKSDSVSFDVSLLANRSGRMNAHLAFDPRDYQNMAINYTVKNMRISDFNPYSKFYVAHAFVEGMLNYSNSTRIHNGMLKSSNVLDIKKIEISRRIKGKGLYALPLRLAVALLRDGNGNVNLDIPVEGNLKDPKYKLGKVIWQILKNIVVKAATAPFKMLANLFGGNEKELEYVPFDYLQQQFDNRQMKNLDFLAKSLEAKPEMNLSLVQIASREREKEMLAMAEAKKRFYTATVNPSAKDSMTAVDLKALDKISNRDSLFTLWLNQQLLPQDMSLMPNEDKTLKLLGEPLLNQQVDSLFSRRNQLLYNYFVNERKVDAKRVKITNTGDEKSAQFESTPRYKVTFFVDEGEMDGVEPVKE